MNVVLTGHTKGVGKAITDQMQNKGWTVRGFSSSTGYNITNQATTKFLLAEAETANIFVNNAHHGFSQTTLLYDWYDKFKDHPEKIHVIIGSHSADFVHSHTHRYEIHKRSIDDACRNIWFTTQNDGPKAKVILVKIGLTDTDMVRHLSWFQGRPNMAPDYVAEKVIWSIEQAFSPGGYIREISIAPCTFQN